MAGSKTRGGTGRSNQRTGEQREDRDGDQTPQARQSGGGDRDFRETGRRRDRDTQ